MKKAVIFSGGKFDVLGVPDISNCCAVCADGGYKHCEKIGIMPDIVIGDMDSAGAVPKGIKILRARTDKDQTDTQLCIDYLAENGFDSADMYCAFGGRHDHSFANYMMLPYAAKKGINLKIKSGREILFAVKSGAEIYGKKGDMLSLFPAGGNCTGITTEFLEYPLKNETLYYDTPRGISNVFKNTAVKVYYKTGILLAVQTEV